MRKVNRAMLVDPLYEPLDMSVDPDLHGQVSKLYTTLMSTFELRKAAWQMQSGLLFEAFPGCTHTRRAHAIGCWILGWNSLKDVKVVTPDSGPVSIPLKDWLESPKEEEGFLVEYLLSLLLHDVGHGPFSHALESNPFLDLNHEEIGRSLICNKLASDGINYYILLKYLLSIFKIKKEPRSSGEYKTLYSKAKRETRLVYDVLEKTPDAKISISTIGNILKGGSRDPKLHALNELVDSEVDIDRIDHFLRDSYYSGMKFADYRVRGILQNLLIIPKGTNEYQKVNKNIQKYRKTTKNSQVKSENWAAPSSYLMIKEEGIEQVEHLLAAREFIFDRVLFHPKNLMLIGALNMGVRLITRFEPFTKTFLPFLTDQIMLQMFREDRFNGTTIEGYERVLRGETPVEEEFPSYKEFLLQPSDVEVVKEVYDRIEAFNTKLPAHPRVIVFSNLRKKRRSGKWWKDVISQRTYLPLGLSDEKELFKWLENKEKNRSNVVSIWYANGVDLRKDVKLPANFLRKQVQ
jgi:HD superfamily phosphohydrolase